MKVPNPSTSTLAAAAASCSAYQAHISKLASSIKPRTLVSTRGSGNYGESGISAFYTIDKLPTILAEKKNHTSYAPTELERVDVDLGSNRLAFTIDNVLSGEEADALASCAESILEHNGHSRIAPGIHTPSGMRINEAAHWYPTHDDDDDGSSSFFLDTIFQRIKHLVPKSLDGLPLYPKLSEKVAHFKYNPNSEDCFNRHVDGLFPGQGINSSCDGVDEWVGVVSGMSLLFYLNDYENDGLIGGETRLWSADGRKYVDVTPKKGKMLAFRRGSVDAVLHAGLKVSNDSKAPKYMALINLAYGTQTNTRPLM